jgi:hypothetical protein
MKKVGLIIFAAAIIFGVVVANMFSFGRITTRIFNFSFNSGVQGSGVTVTEKRAIDGFTGIDAGGIFQVEIVAQKDFSVEVEADDNIAPLVKTYVSDGVLKIERERSFNSHNPVRVRVSAPTIESIEASGACKVAAADLKSRNLSINTGGASKVNLSGETAGLTVDVSGASSVNAENLRAESATVDASGASSVSVFTTGRLRADASGASKISYAGNPATVEKKSSGASKVTQR